MPEETNQSADVTADHKQNQQSDASVVEDSSAAAPAGGGLFGGWFDRLRGRDERRLRSDLAMALGEESDELDTVHFSAEERAMLRNILRLRELKVEDVMIERADIEAIECSESLGTVLLHFEKCNHSRMPVYSENLDNPRGMIHIRDVVGYLVRTAKPKARRKSSKTPEDSASAATAISLGGVDLGKSVSDLGLIRPVLFVPLSMPAADLMAKMQAARIQMALVIDEYGGTDGLVSLEDIVEMVVGNIEDEHDDEQPMIKTVSEGVFDADARIEIEEVVKTIGSSFNPGDYGDDADSLGGLIVSATGRLPARGEVVHAIDGFEFRITDADPRRIKRVRIVQNKLPDRKRRPVPAIDEPREPNDPAEA
jgi:CBS domain containing-hemolysin-like protein